CLHNTLQTRATQIAPSARGAAMSLFACCLFIGQSVGVWGAAWVADHLSADIIYMVAGGGLCVLAFIVARHDPLKASAGEAVTGVCPPRLPVFRSLFGPWFPLFVRGMFCRTQKLFT